MSEFIPVPRLDGGDSDEDSMEEMKTTQLEELLGAGEEGPSIKIRKTNRPEMLVVANTKRPGNAHWSCPRTLPHPDIWPQRPLLFRESAAHHNVDEASTKPGINIEKDIIDFETDLFKGSVVVRIKGGKGTDEYFHGRNRMSSFVITGQFKQELGFEELNTGQEFCYPVKTPSYLVCKAVLGFFKVLAPLLKAKLSKEESYFLSPLAQTVQVLHVSKNPFKLSKGVNVEEETTLLGLDFARKKLTNHQRKKLLSSKKVLAKYAFNTEHYYTFDFYNDKLDLENWQLVAAKRRFDLDKYLNGQPVRVLSRVMSDTVDCSPYLWNFELWHDKQTESMLRV